MIMYYVQKLNNVIVCLNTTVSAFTMGFITVTISTDKLSNEYKNAYKSQSSNNKIPPSLPLYYKHTGYIDYREYKILNNKDKYVPEFIIFDNDTFHTYNTIRIGWSVIITFKLSDIIAVNDTVCTFTDTLEDLDRFYILYYTESINKHYPEFKQLLDSKNDLIIRQNEQISSLQETINRLTNELNSVNNTIVSTVEELLNTIK